MDSDLLIKEEVFRGVEWWVDREFGAKTGGVANILVAWNFGYWRVSGYTAGSEIRA
jgi:hypothetical protein